VPETPSLPTTLGKISLTTCPVVGFLLPQLFLTASDRGEVGVTVKTLSLEFSVDVFGATGMAHLGSLARR